MPRASLSAKLIRTGAALLVIALVSIGLTVWVTWQLEGGAAAVNEAGRLRMQTWRLASTVQGQPAPQAVPALVREFDDSLRLLRSGDPARPLFVPWDAEVEQRFSRVERLWASQRAHWLGGPGADGTDPLASATQFVQAVDALVSTIEQQLSRLTAVLNLFQFVMMALAIGSAVVMLYTGQLYVISPLAHLQEGLRKVESGDFSARVDVDTRDEFGRVAAGFNRMAGTLHSLYGELEAQVQAKTQRIAAQHARLTALYEVSAFLASANTLDGMARGFAQRVRRIAGAEAAAVRWSDEANGRYLMLASDCLPTELIKHEHSLEAGVCACGALPSQARTRIIAIRTAEGSRLKHCARAGYESVVRVPIRLQQRLLGELDLYYRAASVSLTSEEAELLDALASHLVSAMEGLRAAALEREAAVGEERALLASELHDSIAQSLSFLKIQAQLLRSVVHTGPIERTQTVLDELDAGLRESVNDVRELLMNFRTRTNQSDIEGALQETLHKFRHQTGLPAQLHVQGQGLPLPADVQVQVLHVVQEALSNVRKHAGAGAVALEVFKGPRWIFVVRDDGAGFDIGADPGSSHVGLKIMRERAARIGATVSVVARIAEGTVVTLSLPEHPVALAGSSQKLSAGLAEALTP
jgi:two-component system, NarL family, nitrate/nitrite sensor histidine kinase NarX